MMKAKQPLRSRIMSGVYLIYLFRKARGATALKAYVLGVSLGAILYAVSLGNIIENALQVTTLRGLAEFVAAAALNTELSIQLLLTTAALAFVLIVRDLRLWSGSRIFAAR